MLAARTPRCIMMFDGARAVLKCFYMEYKIYALKFFLIFKNMSYFLLIYSCSSGSVNVRVD